MIEKKIKQLVVVLGMHRSGTSAITRGLQALGVDLGNSLMPPVAGNNEKGFFEDIEINMLNIELLNTLDSDWHALSYLPRALFEQEKLASFKLRAIELLRAKMGDQPFGLKDPRIGRLLPFWHTVFDHLDVNLTYIIAVRHPMSVAQSLHRRDGFDNEKAYYLWLEHILPSILETAGESRVVVDFDLLMADPQAQLERVAQALNLPYSSDSSDVKEYVREFLDVGLLHSRFQFNDLLIDPAVPEDVISAFELLIRLARDEANIDTPEVEEIFSQLSSRLKALSPALNYMMRTDKRILERDGKIADFKQHAANLSQVVAARESDIANLKQHNANLSQVVAACESEVAYLRKSLAEREEQTGKLHHIAERAEVLEGQLKDAEIKINEFLSSTSWRITEPLRTLRRFLRKKRQPERFVFSDQLAVSEVVLLNTESGGQHKSLLPDNCHFDAQFYRMAYPDTCGLDPYFHYSKYGKNEGRLSCAPDTIGIDGLKNLDRSKETVLIVSHDASRTGAPILALNIAQHLKEKKYNVIVFLLQGGVLLADFQEHADIVVEPFPQSHNPSIVSIVLENLVSQAELKFAIVNSILSRPVLPVLSNNFVPSLCLIHEFASYTHPKNAIRDVVLWASQVVFSARIVFENNATQYELSKGCSPIILPQGKCVVPHTKDTGKADTNKKNRIRKLFRPDSLPNNTVVILGAGYVQLRKGVDLFLACAARVVALCPKNAFRFVWVGHGFNPDRDLAYSAYLKDQIARAELENHVCFTGELSDIELAYELSDVLFLSSRLDPLPNVAIDAMFNQLPVICFNNTTGIADLLKQNGLGASCVMPYLDIEQAALCLAELIDDSEKRNRLGKEIKDVGKKLFDMRLYVESLEQHAFACHTLQETEKRDCILIEEDRSLNLDFYSLPTRSAMAYKETVRAFVRSWKSGIDMRKPFPGFHPGIYEDCHELSQTGRNPLAAFIEDSKPKGLWLCDLIQPSTSVQMRSEQPVRVALHIHVFFVDLFLDILQRFEGQSFPLDLLISVPSLEVAEEVCVLASGYANGIVDIRVVPNRGRDLGPLLTEFSETALKNYDVIGHIHTKKSGDVQDSVMGKTWLNFLLENLIGKEYPMATTILEKMAGNEKLGLVFPDDPWVVGWSGNKQIAEGLADEFGINELPDRHFNFPVGAMFWARTQALKPLLTKGFKWEDYPEEPLSYDGTILHALERLLPFVAKKMGYQVSMTHVPSVTR